MFIYLNVSNRIYANVEYIFFVYIMEFLNSFRVALFILVFTYTGCCNITSFFQITVKQVLQIIKVLFLFHNDSTHLKFCFIQF